MKRQEDRPITFFFNGGPGSASVWLHLGFVGPKRIDIPSDAEDPGAPPYRLKDNPSSLLRVQKGLGLRRIFAEGSLPPGRVEGMGGETLRRGLFSSRLFTRAFAGGSSAGPSDAKPLPIIPRLTKH